MRTSLLFLLTVVVVPCDAQTRWPIDRDRHQVSAVIVDSVPQCRPAAPVITADSLGPLHPHQLLAALERACPRLKYTWEWGDEGIPTPVTLVRLGGALVEVEFNDTVPNALAMRLRLLSAGAETTEG